MNNDDAFARAFTRTLQHEGGYARVTGDRDGEQYIHYKNNSQYERFPGWFARV